MNNEGCVSFLEFKNIYINNLKLFMPKHIWKEACWALAGLNKYFLSVCWL